MENNIKDYSQWFQGKVNDVANALSRDDDRSDEELTHILSPTYLCSLTGSKAFLNSSTAQRNQLLADLAAAEVPEGAVTGKTHKDQARAWRR